MPQHSNAPLWFFGDNSKLDKPSERPWHRGDNDIVTDPTEFGHPLGYVADPELVDAVNTALILHKPLLLTGEPGTGKSELAERLAWELKLGAVLRFEAQSLSEANDLFYHFDLVAQMAAANLAKAAFTFFDFETPKPTDPSTPDPRKFITFRALGKAILRTQPEQYPDLYRIAFPDAQGLPPPSPSVVLIDEIDKASRDFPNDLLNGIERLEFRLRELGDKLVTAPKTKQALRPLVIITSNGERDLPVPFLRRCTYYHIKFPGREALGKIIRNRVFPENMGKPGAPLPVLHQQLLNFFIKEIRRGEEDDNTEPRPSDGGEFNYLPGLSELIDWGIAAKRLGAKLEAGIEDNRALLGRVFTVVAKDKGDRERLLRRLDKYPSSTRT